MKKITIAMIFILLIVGIAFILLGCIGPQVKDYPTKYGYALAKCIYDSESGKTICSSTFGEIYLKRSKMKIVDEILAKCQKPFFKKLGFATQRECILYFKPE